MLVITKRLWFRQNNIDSLLSHSLVLVQIKPRTFHRCKTWEHHQSTVCYYVRLVFFKAASLCFFLFHCVNYCRTIWFWFSHKKVIFKLVELRKSFVCLIRCIVRAIYDVRDNYLYEQVIIIGIMITQERNFCVSAMAGWIYTSIICCSFN